MKLLPLLAFLLLPTALADKVFEMTVRASDLDREVKSYPEIGFVLEDEKGKPADKQYARVDLNVRSKDRLVVWFMGNDKNMFKTVNSYGYHAIGVHYARQWFGTLCQDRPVGEQCRGNVRLEAATGEDHSDELEIAKADSLKYRAFKFVEHLAKKHRKGKWKKFLNEDKDDLDWELVILAGSSHGASTAARLAKHTKVARVVCFCGPRDNQQTWQEGDSATPNNRYFGFSHTLDMGWEKDHYCRSWELMGLHKFGPVVNVEDAQPPYQNTRRLITDFDVNNDPKRAHGAIKPGRHAKKSSSGDYAHENVWEYLFTHPVDEVGKAVRKDRDCEKDQR